MWGSIGPGMVPIFEEQIARIESKFTMLEWSKLDRIEKAMIIAVRRVDTASKNLQMEAEMRDIKRRTPTKGKR